MLNVPRQTTSIRSNMTRKHRSSSSESPSYSAAIGKTHRRRGPTQKVLPQEEDYNDESSHENQHEQSEEEEEEEEDDDVDDSESMSNEPLKDPSFSHQRNTYIPETPSFSASDFPNPNIDAYVKIAPLPIFRGTESESPITHLSRFNKVCRANNAFSVDMFMKIFPVTLEDEPALWYDLNIEPYHSSLSWDEVKFSFLQAYYKFEPVEELRAELMGIHQGENESVRSYFLRLQWVLKRWNQHGLNDDLIEGVFVDGLREEFHDWVLMQKPNSLNDALRLAFGFEQLRSVRGKKGIGVVPTCGFCEGSHEEYGCKIREGMREAWRQSKRREWSDEVAKEIVRLVSLGELDEGDDEKGGQIVKKSQCQCSKHQCSKKKLLRNTSIESRISHCH